MKKIYLVRHGQSEANVGSKPQLNAVIKLTDLGHKQAQVVSDWLINNAGTDIASIGVSKFIRTQQTAMPLADILGIKPTIIEGLEEFDYLSFDKIKDMRLSERFRVSNEFWESHDLDETHGEDSESFAAFYAKVAQVLEHFQALPTGSHVMYTHGLWISMLIWQLLGQQGVRKKHMKKYRQFEMSIRARNCEVFCLTLADERLALDYPPAITKVRTRNDSPT